MSSGWGSGSTRRWRRIRRDVLRRDRQLCRTHAEGWCATANAAPHTCTGVAPLQGGHVHHTRGKAAGDDPAHLRAACAACNLAIGNPTRAARTDPAPRPRTKWR